MGSRARVKECDNLSVYTWPEESDGDTLLLGEKVSFWFLSSSSLPVGIL